MDYSVCTSTASEYEAPERDITLKNILDDINKLISESEATLTEVDLGICGTKKTEDPRVACAPEGFKDDMLRVRDTAERVLRVSQRIRKQIF